MLVGLIADTHDNLPSITRAVAYFNTQGVDLVLHAGDFVAPFTANELQKLNCPFIAVFGNNDGDHPAWRERVKGWSTIYENCYDVTLEGKSVLLMHEPENIEDLAASQRYDVIVYGHTHRVCEEAVGKTLLINPGECGAWLTGRSSVAVLQLPEKKVTVIDL